MYIVRTTELFTKQYVIKFLATVTSVEFFVNEMYFVLHLVPDKFSRNEPI